MYSFVLLLSRLVQSLSLFFYSLIHSDSFFYSLTPFMDLFNNMLIYLLTLTSVLFFQSLSHHTVIRSVLHSRGP